MTFIIVYNCVAFKNHGKIVFSWIIRKLVLIFAEVKQCLRETA